MLSFIEILLFTAVLFLIAIRTYFRNGIELPLIIFFFFAGTGLQRYYVVMNEPDQTWAVVNYAYAIFDLSDEKAMLALNYFLLGTGVLLISYNFFSRQTRQLKKVDNQKQFSEFVVAQRTKIIIFFIFFFLLNTWLSSFATGTLSYGKSYFILFRLAIGGLILLAIALYVNLPNKSLLFKIAVISLFLFSAYFSFDPHRRFQFLSWAIALAVFLTRGYSVKRKSITYLFGLLILLFFFNLAGVARQYDISKLSVSEMVAYSWERSQKAEDQNMLDGFMMVLDVYPEWLEYHYGMEHIEILLRPIPRQWWPGKPVGGYANKLGLNDYENVGTVGISQTIYGSFYGEGGVAGIIILSFLYGWLFSKLFTYSEKYDSDMKWILRGIIIASSVPFLRGGDVPGIVAWIEMSYWPVFYFLYRYNKYLKLANAGKS